MTRMYKNIRVVVAQDDGSGLFSPFPTWDDHRGEPYWLAGRELKVGDDNEIHIPTKIMRELAVKGGYLRTDKRFAIAVATKRFAKESKRQFGGEIVFSEEAKTYLEKGKNNSFIPNSAVEDYDTRLKVYDFIEGYTLEFPEED